MTKRNKYLYWIATVWVSLGMTSSAAVQLLRNPDELARMDRLGYPVHLLILLGILKLLGVTVILLPRIPLLKEWAYAGFTFLLIGALFSHLAAGDYGFSNIFPPALLLILTAASWYLLPSDRKPASLPYGAIPINR